MKDTITKPYVSTSFATDPSKGSEEIPLSSKKAPNINGTAPENASTFVKNPSQSDVNSVRFLRRVACRMQSQKSVDGCRVFCAAKFCNHVRLA